MPEYSDYEIKVDYEPGRDDLANSLIALGKLVEGHKHVADLLLSASGEENGVSTSIEMQNIERGSIKVLFKKIFKGKDGANIQDDNLGKFIGGATKKLTKFVNENNELKGENFDGIRAQLVEAYNDAGCQNPLSIETINNGQIAQCLKSLEVPKGMLNEHQTVRATFLGQSYEMNKKFSVDESKIEREYITKETNCNTEISIQVKKPDYLGSSKWSVVYNERSVDAKISDEQWLNKFQNGEMSPEEFPSPQDTMTVLADITVEKKADKELNVELDIKKVLHVHKHVRTDAKLF